MSKVFYDHLLGLEKIEKKIKKVAKTPEEKEELWLLVDEVVHHKALGCILDQLPRDKHEEFLEMFHKSPHNENLIMNYLKKQIGENFEELLRQELGEISSDLLKDLQ